MAQRGPNSGIPVPLIVFFMILLLVTGVMMAILFAPDREVAPPSSTLSYETKPETPEVMDVPGAPVEELDLPEPEPMAETAPPEEAVEEAVEAIQHPGVVHGVVRDVNSGLGLAGLQVFLEHGDSRTTTDATGRYTLSNIPVGQAGVLVRYQGTRYRSTTPLPYQKVTIQEDNPEVPNIDFVLETAGLVWGYVTSQDRTPIASAEVVLCTSDSFLTQAMQRFLTRSRPVRARTNEEGYYELAGVPLNQEWRVYADSKIHAPQLADPFILTASSDSARLDIHMFSGSSVSGRVVDPDNKPLPDADVVCIPAYTELLTSMSTPQGYRDVHTNDEGEFHIQDLAAGDYQLIGRKKGYQVQLSGEPIYADGQSAMTNVVITLKPVDKGSHRIIGEVVTSSGQPVEGAEVSIHGTSFQQVEPIEAEQLTDNRGRFAFNDLPASTYSMEVQAVGFAPRSVPRVLLDQETRVILSQSGRVQGRVLLASDNSPVAGAQVNAIFVSSTTPIAGQVGMPTTVSAADGTYLISVPEGNWMLEAQAEGLTASRRELSILSGDVVQGVDLILSDTGGMLAGVVTTSDDSSPQGANVMLIDYAYANSGSISSLAPSHSQKIGPDGAFSFSGLPAGQYSIIAEHETMANASSGIISLSDGQAITDLQLMLGAGGVLSGVVYKNGQPVPNVLVMVANIQSATQATARTNSEGYYYIPNLAPGNYLVTVIGGSSSNPLDILDYEGQAIEIFEFQEAQLNFGLGDGVTLEGVALPTPTGILGGVAMLRLPGSPPLAPLGGTVNILDAANISFQHTSNIDFSGQFQFGNVQPGLYAVEIYYAFGLNDRPDYRNVYQGQVQVTGDPEQFLQLNAVL